MTKSTLIDYWFSHEDIWFGCPNNIDIEIKAKFHHLFSQEQLKPDSEYDFLHYIILYDQIARHIDRVDCSQLTSEYHTKALEYTNHILINNLIDRYTTPEICFVLLPLRHTKDTPTVYRALAIARELRKNNPTDSYLRRFHYATVASLAKINLPKCLEGIQSTIDDINQFGLLDKDCRYTPSKELEINDNMSSIVKEYQKCLPERKVTVSLSGGVDSMLCAFILKYMGYDVVAIHINYNNRECCDREVSMLAIWCQSMDLPLYIRKVDEIQRDVKCDRSFYEKITKDIRFNAYKFLDRPVVLGHNKDDCLENIFSNIKKCQNYDNLNGMLPISYQKEVTLVRPMLSISKKQIIEIANQCNIPYLEDSTPSWSERGKMRDELIPFLNNFDSRIISGLIKMSTHCSKITETYHGILEESTSINLDLDQNIEIYFCKEYCDLEFWKQTFFHCKKEYDIGSVTNKSIENLICILKSTNPKRKTVLNQSYFAQVIDKDTEYHRGGGIIRTRLVLSKHK